MPQFSSVQSKVLQVY